MDVDEAVCTGLSGAFRGSGSECDEVACPAVLPPFVDELPRLPVAEPTDGTQGGAAEYTLAMTELRVKVHRDLPETTVWGFDDGEQASFPGPVIEAFRGEPVTVTWQNELRDGSGDLREEHYLPVDDCIHGADDGPPKTIIHLHGGHVPSRFDGFPEDAFAPGESATYEYPNEQPAATLWYHDHTLGATRLNVYMGLTGMYVLRDADESALDLPFGAHELPLVIQDRSFRGDGSLIYPEMFEEHFFGDTMLVNGKAWPYLDVDQGKYRFRVLNACNARTLSLSLDDGASFQVIASDGGLLSEPATVDSITLGAGERAELVIDFAGYAPGTERVLQNDAPAPYPGTPGVGVVGDVMKFVVGNSAGYTDTLPSSLVDVEPIDEDDSSRSRDFILQAEPSSASSCGHREWMINGMHWDEITEHPRLGTSEIWRFVNPSGVSHPMHMHLVQFQILDRQAADVVDGEVELMGSAAPPADVEAGWKDTVMVQPGEAVRVIATFTDYTGSFAYHCHILEHEDHEMMRQFVTTTVCGDGVLGQPAEECDDDGESEDCDDDCTRVECGDGVLNASAGERCDDGTGDGDPEACAEPCADAGAADDGGVDGGGADAGGVGAGSGGVSGGISDAGVTPRVDGGRSDRDAGDGDASGGRGDGGCGCRVGSRSRNASTSSIPISAALVTIPLLASRLARRRRSRQH
jgi:spore coat protein A